ncbi:MAG: NAD-dependent epimerase/dehydratase family protein [Bacteroidota bacterium]
MISETSTEKILVIGALGQIGKELTEALRIKYGKERVIASDIREPDFDNAPHITLNVLDKEALISCIREHEIKIIFNLAAILSAKGEANPQMAWQINMDGLLNSLEAARATDIQRIFWPSSIAVFGPTSPRQNTPQDCIMDPNTVYGISKLAGERWCAYYSEKYSLDIRSLRYPGLIGYKGAAGGGTTDYAVDIFHEALKSGEFTCFLDKGTYLPMMYMPDAINATLRLMEATKEELSVKTSYNLAGISFSPDEIAAAIKKHIPDFQITYAPDNRQSIADSWPQSIDDSVAERDWKWKAEFDLETMVGDMLLHLRERYDAVGA